MRIGKAMRAMLSMTPEYGSEGTTIPRIAAKTYLRLHRNDWQYRPMYALEEAGLVVRVGRGPHGGQAWTKAFGK